MVTIRDSWSRYRSVPIIYRLGIAFVLGSLVGLLVGPSATVIEPLGTLFVRLLSMIAIPIVIFSLFMGVRELSPETLGKIGGQVVGLYVFTTTIALFVALAIANVIQPGQGMTLTQAEFDTQEVPSPLDVFLGIVPENPFSAIANGDILATLFFIIVFGLALVLLRDTTADEQVRSTVVAFFDVMDVAAKAMFKLVWAVLEYGVIGVFALMAGVFGTVGTSALGAFGILIATVAIAVGIHIMLIHLVVLIGMVSNQSPLAFLSGITQPLATAASTASSGATLPVSMTAADEELRITEKVYGFALPLGSTINMDGTAMYQGIAAIFAANLVGASLTFGEQLLVVGIAVLASVGTAGVPGAGLILLTLVLTQLGLPLEVVGFVAGIDPILDRLRVLPNITGDLAVATVVGKWNNEIAFTEGIWEPATQRESATSD